MEIGGRECQQSEVRTPGCKPSNSRENQPSERPTYVRGRTHANRTRSVGTKETVQKKVSWLDAQDMKRALDGAWGPDLR